MAIPTQISDLFAILGMTNVVENTTTNDNNNTIPGATTNDYIDGKGGIDTLSGGDGNDFIQGGAGIDILNGGAGTDTVSYADVTGGGVTVLMLAGTALTPLSGGVLELFSAFENAVGSNQNDTITGDNRNNVLAGLNGNDALNGGNGNDTLNGGAGGDTLNGGGGIDTADYSTSGAGVTVKILLATTAGGDADGDTLTAIENLRGGAYGDFLVGDTGTNIIQGGGGSDFLVGAGGNDTFVYKSVSDFFSGGRPGVLPVPETIGDFTTGDKIDLSALDANTNTSGVNDAFTSIGVNFTGLAGSLAYHEIEGGGVGDSNYLSGDTNGDTQADFTVFFSVLSDVPTQLEDFIL